jgi:chromate transporter
MSRDSEGAGSHRSAPDLPLPSSFGPSALAPALAPPPETAAPADIPPTLPPVADSVTVTSSDVSLWRIFSVFCNISARSWGGGAATTFVMHQALTREKWLTSAQFFLDFGLCRIVPGINLLAMAVVVGYRLRGLPGALLGLTGLMLPASLITLALTAGFVVLTAQPIGEAAIKGAVAVTAAMTYTLAIENAQAAWPGRNLRLVVPMTLFSVGAFVAIVVFHMSAAVAIILGGFFGAFCLRSDEEPNPERRSGASHLAPSTSVGPDPAGAPSEAVARDGARADQTEARP